jgi:IS1 family transposase
MNQLTTERRAAVVKALVEGNSIRATVRMTGTAKNTVQRLLLDLGDACWKLHDERVRNVRSQNIQCDEIWSFVGAKQKNVSPEHRLEHGDVWTWVGLDADSKLAVSYFVGSRHIGHATEFMRDLVSRLANRVQLTTDGHKAYLRAVEAAFGWDGVDYAVLQKLYASTGGGTGRYSPPVCVGAIKEWVMGEPLEHKVSTSFVERQNLTMRMEMRRFTRLTNGYSKKLAHHVAAVRLHFAHYNFCRVHHTLTKAKSGVHQTPAMAAGLTDHVWRVSDLITLLASTK